MRIGGEYEFDKERQAATAVASAAWICEISVGALVVEAMSSVWQDG